MEFEWDEEKRQQNIVKHGVDFARARAIFDGRPRVDVDSTRSTEARMLTIALLDGVHVAAIWTERSNKVRFISIRPASRNERALFGDLAKP